ncbi:MAG TPA: zinc-binding alcohol dehydrogenase family protein [Nitrososphaerales archaeon]|nr:zinc-binding alcohol dehydrogenase family protein [Nitrososphaerales archaeon]
MKAMVLHSPAKAEQQPLKLEEDIQIGHPKENEVLVDVEVCGVCRTDLHVVEGDLPPVLARVIPGHEIVGIVEKMGGGVRTLAVGDRVGVPWLHHTCGRCEFCINGRENLCNNKVFTGYTVNGGYAQQVLGEEGFVFRLPENVEAKRVAPFLCAGIIGYRAFKVALPGPGGRIGFFGFGGSAHLILQFASKLGYETVAYSRNTAHLELAKKLGASEAILSKENRPNQDEAKRDLDGAIVFAPAGSVALEALSYLKKGATVAIAAIHMDTIPPIEYDKYLFGERKVVSVEANTRTDAKEFLELATRLNLDSAVTMRPLAEANEALVDLKNGRVSGAFVLDCR